MPFQSNTECNAYKMRIALFIICIILSFYASLLHSQSVVKLDTIDGIPMCDIKNKASKFIIKDSLLKQDTIYRDKRGILVYLRNYVPLDSTLTFRDTMFYDPAFLPVVFDGNILPDNLDFRDKNKYTAQTYHLIDPDSTFTPYIIRNKEVHNLRKEFYLNPQNMEKIKYSKSLFSQISPIKLELPHSSSNLLKDLLSTEEPTIAPAPELQKYVPKTKRWLVKGEHSLQITQNHISDNWYQGGNSSFMLRNYHKITIDYKKDKLSFNNTIEWKLGIQSTPGDTLHKININDDQLRTYSVVGYKAFENWSYSSTLEMKTPLFNTYPENSTERKAALLSPLDINLGVGMGYTLNKEFKNSINKKLKFSTNISPFSMNIRYIGSDEVDETKLGLDKGDKTKIDYGSLLNANLEFGFSSFIIWNSRLKYFTNYERVEAEFENKLNMALNKYFSTTISVYFRFDDNSPKDDKLGFFQVNEMLSFGLNYKW